MPILAFETITAEQALAFSSLDSLTISSGTAKGTTVLYLPDGKFSVTIGGRTVVFSSEFQSLTGSRLTYADSSTLYVGSPNGDARNNGSFASTGAMYGGDGNDTLTSSPGDWLVQGNQGDDRIQAYSNGVNAIYGGQGNDRVSLVLVGGAGPGASQFMQGNKGRDTLEGGGGADTLLGGQDDDRLFGGGGQDFLNGNLGDDALDGGGLLYGEAGNDQISTAGGISSTAYGGDGNDLIQVGGATGVASHNVALGDQGNDTLTAFTDTTGAMYGGDGNDLIQITQNLQFGAAIYGKVLDGGGGADTLVARVGDDTLVGGAGADSLSGGDGSDLFVLEATAESLTLTAADRVGDWTSSDHFRLRAAIGSGYAESTATDFAEALANAQAQIAAGQIEVVAIQVGSDVMIFADASPGAAIDTIAVLVGRSLADISVDNFI